MKPELKRKWVKALLSGEYKQGHGKLYDGRRFCCLGVLRQVNDHMDDRCTTFGTMLVPAQLREFGLTEREQVQLANLNDEGVPFDMIAGLIDEAL